MAKILNHIDDIAVVAGTGFLFYGLWQIYSPLAFIFVGAELLLLGLVFAGTGKRGEN